MWRVSAGVAGDVGLGFRLREACLGALGLGRHALVLLSVCSTPPTVGAAMVDERWAKLPALHNEEAATT